MVQCNLIRRKGKSAGGSGVSCTKEREGSDCTAYQSLRKVRMKRGIIVERTYWKTVKRNN